MSPDSREGQDFETKNRFTDGPRPPAMQSMLNLIKDLARGVVIGVANVIPGVSGGTMALVMGIYERFIAAIHNLSGQSIVALLDLVRPGVENRWEKFKHEFDNVDAWFLIKIAIGAGIAILVLARLMSYLLNEYHDPTYGFFWGLVLVSVIAPYQMIKKKTPILLLIGLIGAVAVIGVTGSVSDETLLERARVKHERELKKQAKAAETQAAETGAAGAVAAIETRDIPATGNAQDATPADSSAEGTPAAAPKFQFTRGVGDLLLFFVMGATAISATMLPGISGSLLMIIMGGYFEILKAVDDVRGGLSYLLGRSALPETFFDSIILLGVFAIGCGFGLLFFSRLLDYLLHRFHDTTMAFLTGLVVGSLWSIWPFKKTAVVGDATIYLSNVWPTSFGSNELITLALAILGIILVGAMIWLEGRVEPDEKKS